MRRGGSFDIFFLHRNSHAAQIDPFHGMAIVVPWWWLAQCAIRSVGEKVIATTLPDYRSAHPSRAGRLRGAVCQQCNVNRHRI